MTNAIFFISLFLIILIVIPITFKGKISYSILDNLGSVGIYLFNVKLFSFLFMLSGNKIIIKTKKMKKEIEIDVSGDQIRFVEQLLIQIKNKIYLKLVLIDSKIGIGDAFYSAIISGAIMNILLIFLNIVKNKKKYSNIEINNFTSFNETVMQITSIIRFSISIFDILYSLLMSMVITKRSDKYEIL